MENVQTNRTYTITYIDSNGKTIDRTTPFFVCAQIIAIDESNKHGNAQIHCSDPTFRSRWYEHGEEVRL